MFEKTSSLASGSQLPLSTFLGPWMSLCLLPASTLNPEKAAMVSNLLVVLCADEPAQPVINSGTLNH